MEKIFGEEIIQNRVKDFKKDLLKTEYYHENTGHQKLINQINKY